VNVTRQGALLVRTQRPVRIGSPLVDAHRKPIGRVIDVIGPVKAPYLVVRGAVGGAALLGKETFAVR
jgi:rRNA processing protein Gar1